MIEVVLNIFIVIIAVSLVNALRYVFKIRKIIKMNRHNPNILGISIVNGEIKVIEKEQVNSQEVVKDVVLDAICGKEIEKKEAYRMIKEGKEYFFCSWECREAFLAAHQ